MEPSEGGVIKVENRGTVSELKCVINVGKWAEINEGGGEDTSQCTMSMTNAICDVDLG